MTSLRSPFMLAAAAAAMILFTAGCESSNDPARTEGTLTLSSAYSTAGAPATRVLTSGARSAVDSISITRARFVIRDIKFKSVLEDSLNFKTSPFVLTLNLAGAAQSISSIPATFGSYKRVEFDIHRIEQVDVDALPAAERPPFADFLAGDRYSMIIEGTVTRTGAAPAAFTYRSRVNARQKVDLNPVLVIDEGATEVNTTLLLSSNGWFRDGSGALMDPAVPANENQIDDNIIASIRVFKDNNRDGRKD